MSVSGPGASSGLYVGCVAKNFALGAGSASSTYVFVASISLSGLYTHLHLQSYS